MRLVIDTNVLVSAFLWRGTAARLIELAGEKVITLCSSTALIEELSSVLHRKKFAKQVVATGLKPVQMIQHYRRLVTVVTAHKLDQPVSRDRDDDAVLACARAAMADAIVSGDDDLLVLKSFAGIPILTTAQVLQRMDVKP